MSDDLAPSIQTQFRRPRVVVSVPDGFNALALSSPGFTQRLCQACDLVWLAPDHLMASLPEVGERQVLRTGESRWRTKLANLAYNARLEAGYRKGRLPDWPIIRRRLNRTPLQAALLAGLSAVFSRSHRMERWASRIEPDPRTDDIRRNVDLLLFGSGGVKRVDHALANATRRGPDVPRYGFVQSWDNLTSKLPGFDCLDRLAVWNDHMKLHAVKRLGYDEQRVAVVGVPQFDILHDFKPRYERSDWLTHFGWPAEARYLLFGGINSLGSSSQADYVSDLLNVLPEFHVLVRSHPSERGRAFDGLRDHPRVRITTSGEAVGDEWRPAPGQQLEAAEQIHHAEAVIGLASTLTLEALRLGRPAVNLAYDTAAPVGGVSVAEFLDTDHYRPVTDSPAVAVVRSRDELGHQVEAHISHWHQLSGDLERINRWADPFCDGQASQRLAEDVLQFLERRKPSA